MVKKDWLFYVCFICSIILVFLGFLYLDKSTVWGMEDALFILGQYQNVKSDTTDIFDNMLKSSIWTYKIMGILLVAIGAGLFFAFIPSWILRKEKSRNLQD